MGNITGLYTCPGCSRSVTFADPALNFAACACGYLLFRDGTTDTLHNKPALIINKPTDIIQPGTTGRWQGQNFVVTGRFRAWFEESVFNYWTILLADGSMGYLGEAYGLYAVYEPLKTSTILLSHKLASFTQQRPLNLEPGGEYWFLRHNKAHLWDVEGSFYKPDGQRLQTWEGRSPSGYRIEIFESGTDRTEAYTVHPATFDALELTNLRQAQEEGRMFACSSCERETLLQHYPYTQSWVCNHCGNRFSLQNTRQIRAEGKNKEGEEVFRHLEQGADITFASVTYKVIGFALKRDAVRSEDIWREYTLYSKTYGYAFLTESEGHWMLLKESMDAPSVADASAESFFFKGKEFELFNKYNFQVLYAAGEFPGNIFNDANQVKACDFIAPPEVWSVERSRDEGLTWFHGNYIERHDLKKQVPDLPRKTGIAPAEPTGSTDILLVIRTTLVALLALIAVHVFLSMSSHHKVIVDSDFMMVDSLSGQTYITPKFELRKWKSNLEFNITAGVDNSWFELNATLVNAGTGDEYSLEQGVEYYHGYTDGENWSEGSMNETAYLSSIPAGTYFLQLHGQRDAGVTGFGRPDSFHVKVVNDVPMLRNFILTALLLLIWPVYKIIRSHYTERARWYNSPYSKYNYEN